jgi:polyisoprenoid-binding protein YceI
MKMMVRLLGALLVTACAETASAQHQTFHINPSRSLVQFSVEGTRPNLEGTFRVEKSAIEFDKKGPKIGGSIIVRANTERSGESLDKRIRNEVLQTPEYSEIIFEPKSFTGSIDVSDGKSDIQVTGTLTMHGTTHDVTVPVEIDSNGNRCTARARLVIPYVQWGLKDLSGLNIQAGPQVDIDLTLVGF